MFMKKYVGIAALITTIVLGIALDATAQETTFEAAALYKLKAAANKHLGQGNRRITILEESFENGSPVPIHTEKYVREIIPPDRSRFISEKKTKNGIERTEYIDIGTQRFIKKNGGKWEVFKPTGRGVGSGSGSGSGSGEDVKVETSSAYKLNRGVVINNQKTDYYETTITFKYLYPTETVVNISKEGYWFDAQGRYVKTLEESFGGKDKSIRRKTTHYEYDADIKIEAPIK